MNEDIFRGCGIEIILNDDREFGILRETLSRIGIASKKEMVDESGNKVNTLFQSVHVLKKTDRILQIPRYCLMHFKHLFKFDNKPTNITEDDIKRFNTIVYLVSNDWNLCDVRNAELLDVIEANRIPMSFIKIINHKEKVNWNLVQKYSIGNRNKVTNVDEEDNDCNYNR